MHLTLKDAVRKRPGMYFGDMEYEGVNRVVYELVANAVDLYLTGNAQRIGIEVKDQCIVVSDDGPGFPFSKISQRSPSESTNLVEHYLTNYHNAPTADDHAPHIHILGGGLGLAVLNAASKMLTIESSDGEESWRQDFGEGMVLSPAIYVIGKFQKGSKVSMTLDPAVFGKHKPNLIGLRGVFFELAHLYPGLAIEFNGERFCSTNGLLDFGYLLLKKSRKYINNPPKLFKHHCKKKDIEFQVAALGDSVTATEFKSWINGCLTVENGSHVEGFGNALKQCKWQPEIALIHVVMHDPKYAGPCKDALKMPEVSKEIENALVSDIRIFLVKNVT